MKGGAGGFDVEAFYRALNDVRVEAEADYLASVLLVPEDVVMAFARQGVPFGKAAALKGMSPKMMRWRFNSEGAEKRTKRERGSRG